VLIIFELTGDYRIILPLMLAVIVATALANHLTDDTIYTLKLRRRGIDINRPAATLMVRISVTEAMGKLPQPLASEQPLHDVLNRFANERSDALPVIDSDGTLLGVITAIDIEQAITNSLDGLTARSLVHEVPELRVDQSLEDAVRALATTDQEGLPVLDPDGENVIGLAHTPTPPTRLPRAPRTGALVRDLTIGLSRR
jgi:CIC family chloride channel protein